MKVKNKLPHGVPGITLRPRSIKSGRPLQSDLSVQYRSDLYMQELYNRACQLQDRLQNALSQLSVPAAAASGFSSLEVMVEALKRQCDETIIVLQIAKKIDSELYFAREGLKNAIDAENSSLIHLRRKRVQWLEGKLEDIAVRSSSQQQPTAVAFSAATGASLVAGGSQIAAKSIDVTSLGTKRDTAWTEQSLGTKPDQASSVTSKPADSAGPRIKPVLLTEVSGLTTASGAAHSRVTIKTPEMWEDDAEDDKRDQPPRDGIDDYWSSEHHRFEFSALAPVMASLDPNTLHQVALAVPGTYVSRPSSELRPELPWRDQSDDIHDIHREAFDRLSVQIHQMYDRVYDAAMASVNQERAATGSTSHGQSVPPSSSSGKKQTGPPSTAGVTNGAHATPAAATSAGTGRASAGDLPASAAASLVRQRQLPPLNQDADVSLKHAPPLVYHPKPIPPPQQLPLTRVNRDRHYPQPIAAFALPFNESERERPERLVNQGTMYDDTRLVIYKPANKPRTAAMTAATTTSFASGLTSGPQTAPAAAHHAQVRAAATLPLPLPRVGQQLTGTAAASGAQQPREAVPAVVASSSRTGGALSLAASLRRGTGMPAVAAAAADAESVASTRLSAVALSPASGTAARAPSRGGSGQSAASTPQTPAKRDRVAIAAAASTPESSDRKQRRTATETAASSAKEVADGTTSRSTVSIKKTFNLARLMAKFREGSVDGDGDEGTARSSDDQLKSGSADHSGLKWERVKELVKVGLTAPASEERADAAKQLGLLRCTDPSVVMSLKQQIVQDDDERVQYECTKSLLSLGCLENEIVQIAVDYLVVGNQEVRLDVIKCISNARNIQYVSKKPSAFVNLVKALAHFCQSPDPDDPVSYEAAVCFGKLCVKNPHAVDKMRRYLVECKDTHKKALTLRILIKQFNEGGWGLVEAVLEQLTSSAVWEYRVEAAQLLQHLGRRHVASTSENAELVYSILEQRLWDDSQELVRLECAKTMVLLEMYARASETAIRQLSDASETVRAHAVTSLGTLGVKTNKIVRHLLEMLDLDPSDMVRRQVIRAFGAMSLNDKRVVRALKERERAEGMLGSEAKKVLHRLETAVTSSVRPSAAA